MWDFWGRWSVATMVGWVVGLLLAIVLSYLVVNPFYPEETNLIVGLCLGATVSYLQRFAIRRWLALPPIYVWGAAIGIGIPFVVTVFMNESGVALGAAAWITLLATGALICGLLQAQALRGRVAMPYLWVLATVALWTLAWMITRSPSTYALLGATLTHGGVSGAVLIWLTNQRQHLDERVGGST